MLPNKVIEILRNKSDLAWAIISPHLTIESTSPKFERLYNRPGSHHSEQLVSECLWEFAGAEPALQRILAGEADEYRLVKVNRKETDGSIRYYDFLAVASDADNPGKGLLLIATDSTEQGRLQQEIIQDRNELRLAQIELQRLNAELHRLSRIKSVFLSMAAHEMRSPLSAILAYSDLLKVEMPNPGGRAAEYVQVVQEQVEYLNRLIQDFLELDLLDQGKQPPQPEACELDAAIEKIAKALRPSAQRKEITFQTRTTGRTCLVRMDRARLEQVLYNLISNAVKYTQRGGVIEVLGREEGDEAILEVKDSGLGIPTNEIGHLFELYYRTPDARMSGESGFGLGLYIVKELIRAYQGSIEVNSQSDQGTTFIVRLPRENPEQNHHWIV